MPDNDFDTLLDDQPEAPAEPKLDKEAYAAMKKQERDGLYALADTTALDVAADPARFAQYLDVQARFDYSPTNVLLVMAQRPDATWLGSTDYWRTQKVFIKPDEMKKAITIITPGKDYRRDDGGVGTSMNPARVYDISQAKIPKLQPEPRFDDKTFTALKKASQMQVRGADTLAVDAVTDPGQGTITVRKGMSRDDTIRALARESCRAVYLRQGGDPEVADLAARAGAYIICKKYGVDTQGIDLSDAPEYLGRMEEPRDVRDALSDVRKAAVEITGRMAKELDAKKQEAR